MPKNNWEYYKTTGRPGPNGSYLDNNRASANAEARNLDASPANKSPMGKTYRFAVKQNKRGVWEVWRRRNSIGDGMREEHPLEDVEYEAVMHRGKSMGYQKW